MKRIAGMLLVVLAVAGVLWADSVLSITGAGATFPYPMYSKWFDEYHKKNANLEINYQSIGSGGGINQVTEGTVDFGATDGPMNDEQLKAYQDKHGFGILHFPTVLGADVPAYNIPGVTAAAAGAAKNMPDDFRVSITDAPGKTAYPISSFTWLLVPAKFSDATKRDALKGFVKWMLADGQNYTEALSYAKLPKEVVTKELKALNSVQ